MDDVANLKPSTLNLDPDFQHPSSLTLGLPGTAKTSSQIARVGRLGDQPFLFLAFSRARCNALVSSHHDILSPGNTFTLHSILFRFVRVLGDLPAALVRKADIDSDPITEVDDATLRQAFRELETSFLSLDPPRFSSFASSISDRFLPASPVLLVVDEVQDFTAVQLDCVRHLQLGLQVPVDLAGDYFQQIFAFQKGMLDFDSPTQFQCYIEKLFQILPENTVIRRHNFRSPFLSRFMNAFYSRFMGPEFEDFAYTLPPVTDAVSLPEPEPQFYFLPNWQSTEKMLTGLVLDAAVLILARTRRECERLRSILPDMADQIQTVHASKGDEADDVILVNFGGAEDSEEKRILGVALSRARKSLRLITSFPAGAVLPLFDLSTLTICENRQPMKHHPLQKHKSLESGFKTLIRYNTSSIDSLHLRVLDCNAPFKPYVANDLSVNRLRARPYNQKRLESHGLCYTLVRSQKGNGYYEFRFNDLNALRFAGYNDIQLLRKVADIVAGFFDNRVAAKSMLISRIDIGKVRRFSNARKRRTFVRNMFATMDKSRIKSIVQFGGERHESLATLVGPAMDKILSLEAGVYLNLAKKRGVYPRTLTLYDPSQKTRNRIPLKNSVKIELRLRGLKIVEQRQFLRNHNNLAALQVLVRDEHWCDRLFKNSVGISMSGLGSLPTETFIFDFTRARQYRPFQTRANPVSKTIMAIRDDIRRSFGGAA